MCIIENMLFVLESSVVPVSCVIGEVVCIQRIMEVNLCYDFHDSQ